MPKQKGKHDQKHKHLGFELRIKLNCEVLVKMRYGQGRELLKLRSNMMAILAIVSQLTMFGLDCIH